MSTGTVSTHVLDAALGSPAAGLEVVLGTADGEQRATTDPDGRIQFEAAVLPGRATLTFATGAWFQAQERGTFYPEAIVVFEITAGEHHHVALLLSPFAYTTYRGS